MEVGSSSLPGTTSHELGLMNFELGIVRVAHLELRSFDFQDSMLNNSQSPEATIQNSKLRIQNSNTGD